MQEIYKKKENHYVIHTYVGIDWFQKSTIYLVCVIFLYPYSGVDFFTQFHSMGQQVKF